MFPCRPKSIIGRGGGTGGAGGAIAQPTYASFNLKDASLLAPPTIQWLNAKAPPIFHTFRHPS